MKTKSMIRAGALTNNHNQGAKVRTGVKSGAITSNHNQTTHLN